MTTKQKNTISIKQSLKQDFPGIALIFEVLRFLYLAYIPLLLLYSPYIIVTSNIDNYIHDTKKAKRLAHIWVTVAYIIACIVSETVRQYVFLILGLYVSLFQIFLLSVKSIKN